VLAVVFVEPGPRLDVSVLTEEGAVCSVSQSILARVSRKPVLEVATVLDAPVAALALGLCVAKAGFKEVFISIVVYNIFRSCSCAVKLCVTSGQ